MINLLKLIHWFGSLESVMTRNIDVTILEIILLLIACYFFGILLRKTSWKNGFNLILSLLLFIFARTLINFKENQKNEITSHFYFKNQFLSIKNGKNILFLLPEKSDVQKLRKYTINPYLTARRNRKFHIKYYRKGINMVVINAKYYPLD